MSSNDKRIILIPARLASVRLPNKPLADMGGEPMIVQVWRRACEANIGRVVVAAAEAEIADAIINAGGEAVLTDPALPSGSDRIHQALQKIDPDQHYQYILNVQGDLPTIEPIALQTVSDLLDDADMSTIASKITNPAERDNPNVVKAVIAFDKPQSSQIKSGQIQSGQVQSGKALYFTRATAPAGDGDLYHHIGLYGFRRTALDAFIKLPPSALEKREKLEQLRALEAGMSIRIGVIDTVPIGVDTPEDLTHARKMMERA